MISFTRGLVLRRGERTLEFERDLGNGEIQLKYLDTFEVKTFSLAHVYRDLLAGVYAVAVQAGGLAAREPPPADLDLTVLPGRLDAEQEALIAFRMHYVKAAIRMRAQFGSSRQCAAVIDQTRRPSGVDGVEDEIHARLSTPSPATLMRWLKVYRLSGANPFMLCDRRALAVKAKRLLRQVEELVDEAIVKTYMQRHGKSMRETWRQAVLLVESYNRRNGDSLAKPSESTVLRRINEIPIFTRDSKRYGSAYARNKWRFSMAGDMSTRILERAEIDHTLLDLWALDPTYGLPLGRPWITVVIDRMSGYLLGIYISFYGPTAATVANALKMAILPKDEYVQAIPEIQKPWTAMGIAETYVVDNGMEFHSHVFRRIAWNLRADLIYNPVRQPWFKAAIERAMMEFNRVLPINGKVFGQIKNVQAIDPRKTAAILFDDLCASLIQWAAEVFPYRIHEKTLVRPIDLWEDGRLSGPPPVLPTSLDHLNLATGIATERTIGADGVFFQYLRYNSPELQDYCRRFGRNFRTEVRFNPDNLGKMQVHLPKAQDWLTVPLQRPGLAYGEGLSLVQHQLNRKEAGKRLGRRNADEELLRAEQRNRDRWSAAVRAGGRVRKSADLVKQQGLTSARLLATGQNTGAFSDQVLEVSPIAAELLPRTVPFATMSLNEDLE